MIFLRFLGFKLFALLFYFSINFLLEAWSTADENNHWRNVLFNVTHGITYLVIESLAGIYFIAWLTLEATRLPTYGIVHLGWTDGHSATLAILLSLLSLAINDFFYYWMHRLQHRSAWLWAEHELHHSEEHVNVTTGIRHHQLEIFLKGLFVALPLTMFQLPRTSVVAGILVSQFFIYFIHANARIGFGPLNRFIANPQVHRIHHSKSPEHIDKNFAAYFPFWDVLFGTYYHPKSGEYPATGLISGRTVYSLREAALMPFVSWWKMLH